MPHGLYIDTRVAGAVVVEAAGFAAVLCVLWASGIALSPRGLPVVALALGVVALYGLACARRWPTRRWRGRRSRRARSAVSRC